MTELIAQALFWLAMLVVALFVWRGYECHHIEGKGC